MRNNYENLITYYRDINDENAFDAQIEALENDTYNKQLMLEIIDALQDEVMLKDFTTALIREMFAYYVAHKDEHK